MVSFYTINREVEGAVVPAGVVLGVVAGGRKREKRNRGRVLMLGSYPLPVRVDRWS
jgi:hypothetical protein